MDCPVCREAMIVLELDEVEIDYCADCGGIWLDAGELELLLADGAEKDSLLSSFQPDKKNTEIKRRCPICLKKMEKVLCGRDTRILIDKCRKNDGIWFDKGELEDLIEMASLDKNNRILNLLKEMFVKKQ